MCAVGKPSAPTVRAAQALRSPFSTTSASNVMREGCSSSRSDHSQFGLDRQAVSKRLPSRGEPGTSGRLPANALFAHYCTPLHRQPVLQPASVRSRGDLPSSLGRYAVLARVSPEEAAFIHSNAISKCWIMEALATNFRLVAYQGGL